MSKKLTPERLAEIRDIAALQREPAEEDNKLHQALMNSRTRVAANALHEVLAELDRITPQWVPVSQGTYMLGRTYEVACTSPTSPTPVWMGRAKYVEQVNAWLDSNTGLPFAKGIEVTHFLKQLAPHEAIGQPTL